MTRLRRNDCRNMNHGRLNPPVNYCPNCGDRFGHSGQRQCDHTKHLAQRKDRSLFCCDCGKDLSKLK